MELRGSRGAGVRGWRGPAAGRTPSVKCLRASYRILRNFIKTLRSILYYLDLFELLVKI